MSYRHVETVSCHWCTPSHTSPAICPSTLSPASIFTSSLFLQWIFTPKQTHILHICNSKWMDIKQTYNLEKSCCLISTGTKHNQPDLLVNLTHISTARLDDDGWPAAWILLSLSHALLSLLVGVICGTHCDFVLDPSQAVQLYAPFSMTRQKSTSLHVPQ